MPAWVPAEMLGHAVGGIPSPNIPSERQPWADGGRGLSHFPFLPPQAGCTDSPSPNTRTRTFPDGYWPRGHSKIALISSCRATSLSHCCVQCACVYRGVGSS